MSFLELLKEAMKDGLTEEEYALEENVMNELAEANAWAKAHPDWEDDVLPDDDE